MERRWWRGGGGEGDCGVHNPQYGLEGMKGLWRWGSSWRVDKMVVERMVVEMRIVASILRNVGGKGRRVVERISYIVVGYIYRRRGLFYRG